MVQGDESNNKLYIILEGKTYVIVAKDTNVFKRTEEQDNEAKQA